MAAMDVLCDIKVWVVLAIVLALLFGYDGPGASTIMMVALIAQMSVSLDGLRFSRGDFREYRRPILWNVVCCFGVCTGITLLVGLLFIDDTALWVGWVMLAAVPCAISTVPSALYLKADTKLAVLSLIVVYVVALALTPLITHVLIGDAVDPLEVLKYIVLFIVIPFAVSFVLRRFHLRQAPKTVFINVMMFVLLFVGLGSRRDYVFSEPDVVLALVAACVVKVVAVSVVLMLLMRKAGVRRDYGLDYVTFAYWKNSGMAASVCMSLFATTMPEAVLPCVVSLIVEGIWFAALTRVADRIWPPPAEEALEAPSVA